MGVSSSHLTEGKNLQRASSRSIFARLTLRTADLLETPFLPVDLPLYDLGSREPPVSIDTQGHIPVEFARKANSFFTTALGGDQSSFSPLLSIDGQAMDNPPYLAVSDSYLDFVRSGEITVSTGRLESLSGNVAVIKPSGERIPNLAAVVLATGFDASSSLSFLPKRVRETLSVAPDDLGDTVALAFSRDAPPRCPEPWVCGLLSLAVLGRHGDASTLPGSPLGRREPWGARACRRPCGLPSRATPPSSERNHCVATLGARSSRWATTPTLCSSSLPPWDSGAPTP